MLIEIRISSALWNHPDLATRSAYRAKMRAFAAASKGPRDKVRLIDDATGRPVTG